jgi:hypothetical protein
MNRRGTLRDGARHSAGTPSLIGRIILPSLDGNVGQVRARGNSGGHASDLSPWPSWKETKSTRYYPGNAVTVTSLASQSFGRYRVTKKVARAGPFRAPEHRLRLGPRRLRPGRACRTLNKFDHPTQKPIDLMRCPILNDAKRGEGLYDRFLGSGTTLPPRYLGCYIVIITVQK